MARLLKFSRFQLCSLLEEDKEKTNSSFLEITFAIPLEVSTEHNNNPLLDNHKCCHFDSCPCEWIRNTVSQALFLQRGDIRDISVYLQSLFLVNRRKQLKHYLLITIKTPLLPRCVFCTYFSESCCNICSGYKLSFHYLLGFFRPFSSLPIPSFKSTAALIHKEFPYSKGIQIVKWFYFTFLSAARYLFL